MVFERLRRRARPAALVGFCSGLAVANGCVGHTTGDEASVAGRAEGAPSTGSSPGTGLGGGGFIAEDGGAGFGCSPQAPVPDFGTPVHCSTPPPPVSGGTLLVTRDGSKAIAADPDRDAVYVVDLATNTVEFTVGLDAGDEPGRLAEDGAGRVHVAPRGGGALVTFDPSTGAVIARRSVCPAPRGVAWQASNDTVWVACATGELVSLPAAGGAGTSQHVDRDLRDVIVTGDALAVTQFRSAQVLRLASDQSVARTDPLPSTTGGFVSHVAWRAVAGPAGSIVSVHQAESTSSIATKMTGGYGCGGLDGLPLLPGIGGLDGGVLSLPLVGGTVDSVFTVIGSDGTVTSSSTFQGVLPVDVASSPDGTRFAAVAAGSGSGAAMMANLFFFNVTSQLTSLTIGESPATAVAFATNSEVLVQTREPAALWVVPLASDSTAAATPVSISLSSDSRADTGHDIFHSHAGALLACASCHPEGGDDGHTWLLDGAQRRTPSLRGTIAGTAPYHWPGDEKDFSAIVSDVYVVRMSGATLTPDQEGALSSWVNAIPPPPAPSWVDSDAVAAGRAIFQRTDVGCATCHSGAKFTNNATVDVGTGGLFQVPPLIGVGWRTPLLHDGCAETLADRFGACQTSLHGNVSSLSAQDVTNLIAYLETL